MYNSNETVACGMYSMHALNKLETWTYTPHNPSTGMRPCKERLFTLMQRVCRVCVSITAMPGALASQAHRPERLGVSVIVSWHLAVSKAGIDATA